MALIWLFRFLLTSLLGLVVAASLSGPHTLLGALALTPSDKLTHAAAFFLLAVLAVPAFPRARLSWISAAAVTLGFLLELAQGFTGRQVSAEDFLFNCAGTAAGIAPFAAARLRRGWISARGRRSGGQPRARKD